MGKLKKIQAEMDLTREELRSARERLTREAEHVLVIVDFEHDEDGEPRESRDIAYDDDFVSAVIAVKQARAHLDDLDMREFEARHPDAA